MNTRANDCCIEIKENGNLKKKLQLSGCKIEKKIGCKASKFLKIFDIGFSITKFGVNSWSIFFFSKCSFGDFNEEIN